MKRRAMDDDLIALAIFTSENLGCVFFARAKRVLGVGNEQVSDNL